jgi:hypothetical protein
MILFLHLQKMVKGKKFPRPPPQAVQEEQYQNKFIHNPSHRIPWKCPAEFFHIRWP